MTDEDEYIHFKVHKSALQPAGDIRLVLAKARETKAVDPLTDLQAQLEAQLEEKDRALASMGKTLRNEYPGTLEEIMNHWGCGTSEETMAAEKWAKEHPEV